MVQDGNVLTLDQDEDEEFTNLVREFPGDVDPDDYMDFDKDIDASMPALDAFLASGNSKRNH